MAASTASTEVVADAGESSSSSSAQRFPALSCDAEESSSPANGSATSPQVISPPYWQVDTQATAPRHGRSASLASVASTVNSKRPAPIRLEDNTEDALPMLASAPARLSHDANSSNGHAGLPSRMAASLASPPAKSPLWARVVRIPSHTLVAGAVRGVGDYVVWNCHVDTLDGGTMVLRKRYSEFVTLRAQLQASFPNSKASLPVLPPKSVIKRFQDRFLEKRRAGLEFFMNCVLLNPEFAGSAILKEFVFQ